MGELPLLLTHGGLVWKVVLGALVAGGAALAIARGRRRWSALDVALAGAHVPPERFAAGVEVVVRGRLDGPAGDAAAVTLIGYRYAERARIRASWADEGGLTLAIGERPVSVVGPVRVERGSLRHEAPRLPPEGSGAFRALADRALDGVEGMPSTEAIADVALERVAAGDEVWARGRLEAVAAGDEAGYRDSAGGWALRGTDDEPVELHAIRPRPRRYDVRAGLAGAVLAALAFVVAFGALGRVALDHGRESRSLGWVALAAATPFHRGDALHQARWTLRAQPPSAARTERMIALAMLDGRCDDAVRRAAEHGRFERAVELARGCDRFDAAVEGGRAAMMIGDWQSASDLLARDDTRWVEAETQLAAHLLAGEWDRVAAAARAQADRYRESGGLAWRAVASECLARWAERQGRAAAAEPFLQPGEDANLACLALALDLTPVTARRSLLEGLTPGRERYSGRVLIAGALLVEAGVGEAEIRDALGGAGYYAGYGLVDELLVRDRPLGAFFANDRAALAALEAGGPDADRELLSGLLATDAVVRAWLGDHEGAARQHERAVTAAAALVDEAGGGGGRAEWLAGLEALGAALALYRGDAAEARRRLPEHLPRGDAQLPALIALREPGPPPTDPIFDSDREPLEELPAAHRDLDQRRVEQARALWSAIVAGEAGPIAAALHDSRGSLAENQLNRLYLVAHRFTTGVDELLFQLDHGRRWRTRVDLPRAFLLNVRERDLRRALGDDAGARVYHERAVRLHEALTRRDIATPLQIVLER